MALKHLFRPDPLKTAALAIYNAAGEQARLPFFYTERDVADDFDGRFDLLVIHVHLAMRGLRKIGEDQKWARQVLFDIFIGDMDQGLRLSGVGDIGIGHRVKKMTHAYYGRATSYDAALDAGDREELRASLYRNLYRERDVDAATLDWMTDYVRALDNHVAGLESARLLAAEGLFPKPGSLS